MFATAGNLSFRSISTDQFWISASGKHKGQLAESDFVQIDIETYKITQNLSPLNKPSAETSIHQGLYKIKSEAKAILHVHTLASNMLNFQITAEERYRLTPIPNTETIKAFGIWSEKPSLQMAVFYNYGEVKKIAESIALFFAEFPQYPLPFILVEAHGPTVWGSSIAEANRHLEATAFLLDIMNFKSR